MVPHLTASAYALSAFTSQASDSHLKIPVVRSQISNHRALRIANPPRRPGIHTRSPSPCTSPRPTIPKTKPHQATQSLVNNLSVLHRSAQRTRKPQRTRPSTVISTSDTR